VICDLLRYYAALSGRSTAQRCVTFQKSADLTYIAAKAWSHAWFECVALMFYSHNFSHCLKTEVAPAAANWFQWGNEDPAFMVYFAVYLIALSVTQTTVDTRFRKPHLAYLRFYGTNVGIRRDGCEKILNSVSVHFHCQHLFWKRKYLYIPMIEAAALRREQQMVSFTTPSWFSSSHWPDASAEHFQ
jgi:hypothetical protein